jgi:hypothetical protein
VVLLPKVGLYQFTNNVESVSIKTFEAGPQIGLRIVHKEEYSGLLVARKSMILIILIGIKFWRRFKI